MDKVYWIVEEGHEEPVSVHATHDGALDELDAMVDEGAWRPCFDIVEKEVQS